MFFYIFIIGALLAIRNKYKYSGNDFRPVIHHEDKEKLISISDIYLHMKKKELLNILQNPTIPQHVKLEHIRNSKFFDNLVHGFNFNHGYNTIQAPNLTKGLKW
jgi:hypothetical protein